MLRTDIAYRPVGGKGEEESDRGKEAETEEDEKEQSRNHHHHHRQELQRVLREKRWATTEEVIKEEEDDEKKNDDADSNNNDAMSTSPSRGGSNIIRRTMSFLSTLPRKLFSYVRGVFYSPTHQRWTKVGQDDSEESDWSSSEDGTTARTNKHKRSTAKPKDRHRAKNHRAAPPPIAPKPKRNKERSGTSGSSNPPSSPDTTTPDTTPEISFDDIAVESPKLKPYKRIQGPQGRRRPQRFSNQSEIRQSEIQFENDSS